MLFHPILLKGVRARAGGTPCKKKNLHLEPRKRSGAGPSRPRARALRGRTARCSGSAPAGQASSFLAADCRQFQKNPSTNYKILRACPEYVVLFHDCISSKQKDPPKSQHRCVKLLIYAPLPPDSMLDFFYSVYRRSPMKIAENVAYDVSAKFQKQFITCT